MKSRLVKIEEKIECGEPISQIELLKTLQEVISRVEVLENIVEDLQQQNYYEEE